MKKVIFLILGLLVVGVTKAQQLETYILEAEKNNPEIQAFELKYNIASER